MDMSVWYLVGAILVFFIQISRLLAKGTCCDSNFTVCHIIDAPSIFGPGIPFSVSYVNDFITINDPLCAKGAEDLFIAFPPCHFNITSASKDGKGEDGRRNEKPEPGYAEVSA